MCVYSYSIDNFDYPDLYVQSSVKRGLMCFVLALWWELLLRKSSVQLFGYTSTQAEPRVGADSSGTRAPWPESGRCSIRSDDPGGFH